MPHDPAHRQQHTFPVDYDPSAVPGGAGSLLRRLLDGYFAGDPDRELKEQQIGELIAAATFGLGTDLKQPKAFILLGRSAANGKSQILALLQSFLPPEAVTAVRPTDFGDKFNLIKLNGDALNTAEELGPRDSIPSSEFKAVVTGDTVSARDLHQPLLSFRPKAQQVYASNTLPGFSGGFDRGVMRRLEVMVFNRTIPPDERIPNLGRQVAEQEGSALLLPLLARSDW